MENYLSDSEVNELIIKVKSGDNDAWERICENFDRYIHECAWKRLRKFDMKDAYRRNLEEDLYMAGWQGFVSAVRNYNPERGKLRTYATYYIDGEISKELDILLNPLGLTQRPKPVKNKGESAQISRVSLDEYQEMADSFDKTGGSFDIPDAPVREKYNAERRTLQILKVLRKYTDENNALSKDELGKALSLYRVREYKNGVPLESPNTFTSTLESILQELDPMEHSEDNDADYRIKYEGYKEDRLQKKLNKEKGKKAADITGFSYVHLFDNAQLDQLIQLICFSDMLSSDEKTLFTQKLIGTSSAYYKTPFWDGKKLKFNPKAVHGRFSTRKPNDKIRFANNLKIIQYATNHMGQIRFRFNRYTAEHEMVPSTEYIHELSPYHLVVYHDNYYCIGLKKNDKRIWHYRVDLMSDIEIVRDEEGMIVPIEVSSFEGLPIANTNWNPEKYMAEHLNMAYDEPRDIRIKIKNMDYTIIHDWFGDHYEKTDEMCEDGYDVVRVRTSPTMIIHWAMQYGTRVEIMDEEIRGEIRKEIDKLKEKYE